MNKEVFKASQIGESGKNGTGDNQPPKNKSTFNKDINIICPYSAKEEIKNIINAGNRGIKNQISFWAKTISVKFKDPAHKITEIIINPIDTS